MTNQAAPSTDPNSHGEPMTDQAEPSSERPIGEPITDQARLFKQPEFQGAPMPDDDEPMPDTERQLTPEISARAALNGVTCDLGHDEVRVLTRIAERLRGGQFAYGQLDLMSDARSFRSKEAREEIEDALVYLACAWLKTESNLEVTR